MSARDEQLAAPDCMLATSNRRADREFAGDGGPRR